MILYKYTADCSKLNLEQEDATKERYEGLYPRRSDIAEWNSKFYTAYRTEKKFFIIFGRYCRKWSCLHVRRSQVMSFTKKWSGQNGITGRSATSGQ